MRLGTVFIGLAVLMTSLVFPMATQQARGAEYTWDVDQLIDTSKYFAEDTINLTANVTITGTGSLTLSGAVLTIFSSATIRYHIEVLEGGALRILDNSTVRSDSTPFRYQIWVRPNATLEIDHSYIRDCGYSSAPGPIGNGVYIQSSLATITNSSLKNNYIGIVVDNGSSPQILYNNISDNDFAGVAILNNTSPLIDHNDITGNLKAPSHTPQAAILSMSSSPVITNNTLNFNNFNTQGFGIDASGAGFPTIVNNKIINHKDNVNHWPIHSTLATSLIANNLIDHNANGIWLTSGKCVVENNTITNFTGPSAPSGAGLGIMDFSNSVIRNNVISHGNIGFYLREGAISAVSGCTVSNMDYAAINGGTTTTPFQVTFTNCTLSGNAADILFNISASTQGGTCSLLNTPFDNTTMNLSSGNIMIEIRWFLHVKTIIESTGVIANASLVRWSSTKGGISFMDVTGPDGWTAWVNLMQKSYGNSDEKNITYAPYNVTAEKGSLFNYSLVPMDHNYEFTLPLDDIPPRFGVAYPLEGSTINRTTVNVTGITEPTCAVLVNTVKGVVGPDGEWYANVPLAKEGANVLTASAMDHGKNVVNRTVNVIRDVTPPILTITSPSNDFLVNTKRLTVNGSTNDVSGKTFINDVEIPVNQNDGNFSYDVDLVDGANSVIVNCSDAVWNTATITLRGELDTLAPALVIMQPPNYNLSTNASSLTIKGYTDPQCTVTVNGRPVQLSANENFSITESLVEGQNEILVVSTDRAGNPNMVQLNVLRDSIPPVVSISYPANNSVVNQTLIDLRGTTEPGATIRVNGAVAIPSGTSFSAPVRLDKQGKQTIQIDAYDTLKNHIYIEWVVYLDTEPPQVKITGPAGAPAATYLTNLTTVEIKGRTEKGANVTINEEPVTVDANGLFSERLPLDVEGINTFSILVTDAVGNLADEVIVNVMRDTAVQYTISYPRNGLKTKWTNLTVQGTAEVGSTVTVQGNPTAVRADGAFSSELFLQSGPNPITVTVRDPAGNFVTTEITVEKVKSSPPPSGFIPGFGPVAALAAIGLALAVLWRRK